MSQLVNVDQAADAAKTVTGEISMSRLPRLAAVTAAALAGADGARESGNEVMARAVEPTDTPAFYELHFSRDAHGRAAISGSVAATIAACCQRCMQPMRQPVSSEVQAVLLPAGTEPTPELDAVDWIELERQALNIAAFCDEELLLALPVITRHDDDDEACTPEAG